MDDRVRLQRLATLAFGVPLIGVLLLVGCTPSNPPAPAAAPAKAAPTAEQKTETRPPTAAAPTGPTAATSSGGDDKAVADFYRGKTIRIVVGLAPGSSTDIAARVLAKYIPKYIPGNPNVIVENQNAAGGILAANVIYNNDPKDGTVISGFVEGNVIQQAIGKEGIEFDGDKFQWIGSFLNDVGSCIVRTDIGVNSIQDVINGKEVTLATTGPGTTTQDHPAVLNAVLGTHFKLVPGYEGGPKAVLAVESKEVNGYCISFQAMLGVASNLIQGDKPAAKFIIVLGSEPPNNPLAKGVPAAETLAKTEDDRALLRAVAAPGRITRPLAFAPGVPKDRVEALRTAFNKTVADQEFVQDITKTNVGLSPRTGDDVTKIVHDVLSTPAPILARLKDILLK